MSIQYLQLLIRLVEVSQSLRLWQTDPLLHGELHLKLACLYEAKAEIKGHDRLGGAGSNVNAATSNLSLGNESRGFFQLYDRQQLLECLSELEVGLKVVQLARAEMMEEERGRKGAWQEVEKLAVLHTEYMFTTTRVKVKLASTIPPPREFIQQKFSIIHSYHIAFNLCIVNFILGCFGRVNSFLVLPFSTQPLLSPHRSCPLSSPR